MNKREIYQLEETVSTLVSYREVADSILKMKKFQKFYPSMVKVLVFNSSFGVEKTLKALLKYYDKKPMARIHNLETLFNALDSKTKKQLALLSGVNFRNFYDTFKSNKNAFVEWRYADENQKPIHYGYVREMILIIDGGIFMLEDLLKKQKELVLGAKGIWVQ